jgi:hypothetical protein
MNSKLIVRGALVLTLVAFPVLADPPGRSPEAALAAIFSSAPRESCALPAPIKTASISETGGESTASNCTAHCWDGSTVECTGTPGTTCGAADSSCPEDRGFCWGNSGNQYCPPCPGQPVCQASAICSNAAGSVSCTGYQTPADCQHQDYCFAYCDGVYYWCGEPC